MTIPAGIRLVIMSLRSSSETDQGFDEFRMVAGAAQPYHGAPHLIEIKE